MRRHDECRRAERGRREHSFVTKLQTCTYVQRSNYYACLPDQGRWRGRSEGSAPQILQEEECTNTKVDLEPLLACLIDSAPGGHANDRERKRESPGASQ